MNSNNSNDMYKEVSLISDIIRVLNDNVIEDAPAVKCNFTCATGSHEEVLNGWVCKHAHQSHCFYRTEDDANKGRNHIAAFHTDDNDRDSLAKMQLLRSEITFRTLQVGDIILDKDGSERTVLFVAKSTEDAGLIVNLSYYGPMRQADPGSLYTSKALEESICDYTIKQVELVDDITEITLEEVAAMKGISVDKLRIKD